MHTRLFCMYMYIYIYICTPVSIHLYFGLKGSGTWTLKVTSKPYTIWIPRPLCDFLHPQVEDCPAKCLRAKLPLSRLSFGLGTFPREGFEFSNM